MRMLFLLSAPARMVQNISVRDGEACALGKTVNGCRCLIRTAINLSHNVTVCSVTFKSRDTAVLLYNSYATKKESTTESAVNGRPDFPEYSPGSSRSRQGRAWGDSGSLDGVRMGRMKRIGRI